MQVRLLEMGISNKTMNSLLILSNVIEKNQQQRPNSQLPNGIATIISRNYFHNNILTDNNSKTLNSVEIILYHELTYTSQRKLMLLERDYSSKIAIRARELSSRLDDQKIVDIFNILNLNPGIPRYKNSRLRVNSIATFKKFLEDNDHPQNIIDLLLIRDDKWNSFLTKIVEFTNIPTQNLTNFIYDDLFETKINGQPNQVKYILVEEKTHLLERANMLYLRVL